MLASDVIAGPGQNPPSPHPIPNNTDPITNAGVICVLVEHAILNRVQDVIFFE